MIAAAGALPWRRRRGQLQVVLVHRPHYDDWSWAKGKLDPGEEWPVAAVREVRELGGKSVGAFNAPFFKMLMEYDRIYVFGQAKSHCVLSTLQDLRDHIQQTDASLMDKIWILEDAMSPVPAPPIDPLPPALDFPRIADRAIEEFRKAGMHVVKTSDPIAF